MDEVCGLNKKTYRVGTTMAAAGLIIAATGLVLSALTVGKFTVDQCEEAHEFVDAILA